MACRSGFKLNAVANGHGLRRKDSGDTHGLAVAFQSDILTQLIGNLPLVHGVKMQTWCAARKQCFTKIADNVYTVVNQIFLMIFALF